MKDSIPLAPLQKWAWFNLAVFAAAVILYIIGVPLLAWSFHRTLSAAALPTLGIFGVCGAWGFGSFFFIDRRRRARVPLDERENLISQCAAGIGAVICWEVFVILCMSVWAVLRYVRHQTTLPVDFLPFLILACWIVWIVTHSIAILMQYKRSGSDAI